MVKYIASTPAVGWSLWRVVKAAWCFLAGHITQLDDDGLFNAQFSLVTCARCRRRIRVE